MVKQKKTNENKRKKRKTKNKNKSKNKCKIKRQQRKTKKKRFTTSKLRMTILSILITELAYTEHSCINRQKPPKIWIKTKCAAILFVVFHDLEEGNKENYVRTKQR